MSRQSQLLQLYLSCRAELLSHATRITGDRGAAEEVVQEAWLRFRAGSVERSLDEPVGYLHRIVRNLALDGRRRQRLEARLFAENAETEAAKIASDAPRPEDAIIAGDELRIVSRTLAAMPERMRVAVEMHRVDGARLKDIAARLDVSVTTAHELVAQGVERCRLALRGRH